MSDWHGRRAYDKANELQRELRRVADAQRANHDSLARAFNRVADALEALTGEVRQLREDMNPRTLDKPKMLKPEGGV